MRGKTGKKYKKTGSGKIETTRDFSVIISPNFWKQLKNDDDDDQTEEKNC